MALISSKCRIAVERGSLSLSDPSSSVADCLRPLPAVRQRSFAEHNDERCLSCQLKEKSERNSCEVSVSVSVSVTAGVGVGAAVKGE